MSTVNTAVSLTVFFIDAIVCVRFVLISDKIKIFVEKNKNLQLLKVKANARSLCTAPRMHKRNIHCAVT